MECGVGHRDATKLSLVRGTTDPRLETVDVVWRGTWAVRGVEELAEEGRGAMWGSSRSS